MVTLIKNASLLKKNSIEQRSDGVWEMPGISGSSASLVPCIVCLYKKVTKFTLHYIAMVSHHQCLT